MWRLGLARALLAELPVRPFVTMQPYPQQYPPGAYDGRRADVIASLPAIDADGVFDTTIQNVLTPGRQDTNASTVLRAAWDEKIKMYNLHYHRFAPYITTATGATCNDTRKALLKFCRRACSDRVLLHHIPDWKVCAIATRIHKRMAFTTIHAITTVATRGDFVPAWARVGSYPHHQ